MMQICSPTFPAYTSAMEKPFTSKRIRAIRDALGLSRREAAARLRISHRTWEGWENGFLEPNGPCTLLLEMLEKEAGIGKRERAVAAV